MLDYQVAEKAANRQAEAADDAVYAQMALFQDQAMVAVEAARQVEDRQKEFETKEFIEAPAEGHVPRVCPQRPSGPEEG